MITKLFQLDKHGSNVYTEILAGITVFATAAYVLAVIPGMLSDAGFNKEAVFLALCLGSSFITIVMGLVANIPALMAPGLGIAAYFTVVANQNSGIGNEAALVGILICGIIFLILTISKTRQTLFASIPSCLKNALMAGIGFFILMLGLKVSSLITVQANLGSETINMIQANNGHLRLLPFEWSLTLGDLKQPTILLTLIGLAITTTMVMLQIKGAILIGLVITTLIGIPMGITKIYDIVFTLPNLHNLNLSAFNLTTITKYLFDVNVLSAAAVFTFIGLMDNSTNLMTIVSRVRAKDDRGGAEVATKRAMLIDSAAANLAPFIGLPFFSYYVESLAGISVGGRTGLTSLVIGLLFLVALILSPLFLVIPTAATAPALIIVGVFVISGVIKNIDFNDFSEAFPSLLAMALMPFTQNIADSVSGGVFFYMILKLFQRKHQDIHWIMYVFTLLIIGRYIFL